MHMKYVMTVSVAELKMAITQVQVPYVLGDLHDTQLLSYACLH